MAVDLFAYRTRSYQQEMFERSMERNVIVVMDTGSGKTQVAMLRIQAELDRCPSDKRVWFLAPTVELCIQQHGVLSSAMPAYKMRLLTGLDDVDKWSEQRIWDAALDKARVIVSTHAILADALRHGFVQLTSLALLVYDEAHHCIKKHPANVVMNFYRSLKEAGEPELPHILGLSASLVWSSKPSALATIESNLDSISVAPRMHREDLLQHVHRPEYRLLHYAVPSDSLTPSSRSIRALSLLVKNYASQCDAAGIKLDTTAKTDQFIPRKEWEAIKLHEILSKLKSKAYHLSEELGSWAADYYVYETFQSLRAKAMPEVQLDITESMQHELIGLLDKHAAVFTQPYGEPGPANTSEKVSCLIDYLAENIHDLCGIIFVQQRVVSSVLSVLLRMHPDTKEHIQSRPFVGSNAVGRKFAITELVDLRVQKETLANFREGDINIIVATSVLEEGIDVQACNVVACFDPPSNLKSFIQRRGRARHKRSKLAIFIPLEGDSGIVERFRKLENDVIAICQSDRTQSEHVARQEMEEEDVIYTLEVPSTRAQLDATSTLAHLYHFCAALPHKAYSFSQPDFDFNADRRGQIEAKVNLPDSVPARVREATSLRRWKTEKAAKKDAAFQAYAALYHAGLLNDHLLPLSQDWNAQGVAHELGLDGDAAISGQVDIASSPDIWSGRDDHQHWHTMEIEVVPPAYLNDGTRLSLSLVTRQRMVTPPALPLHWSEGELFEVKFDTCNSLTTELDNTHQQLLHDATVCLFEGPRSLRLSHNGAELSVYFSPYVHDKALEEWLAEVSKETPAEQVFPQAPMLLVRVPLPYSPPYLLRGWTSNGEERSMICDALPRRRAFHVVPVIEDDKRPLVQKEPKVFSIDGCKILGLPLSWARVGLFMPAILQHIQDLTLVSNLLSGLLGDLQTDNHGHFLTAISAPAAMRVTNYQRHEFIGDSILKFVTSWHLYDAYPDWPEGFLSMKRSSLTSNSTLTTAALRCGLDCFIITEPIHYRHWTLPVLAKASESRRSIASKVLADIVEALIGAAWLDAGMVAAVQCINVFIPSVPSPLEQSFSQHESQRVFARCKPVEELIGYTFRNSDLLFEALTHPSSGRFSRTDSYERLEFLGDAVLDMLVTEGLAGRIHDFSQGWMTKIKAALVNARLLGFLCFNLRLKETLRIVTAAGIESTQAQETPLAAYLYFQSEPISAIHQACEMRYQEYRSAVLRELSDGASYPWVELSRMSINKVFSDIIESILGAIFVDSGRDMHACLPFLQRLGFQEYATRVIEQSIDVVHPRDRLQHKAGSRPLEVKAVKGPHGYTGCVTLDGVLITEVQGCLGEEDALVLASSQAEMLISAKDVT